MKHILLLIIPVLLLLSGCNNSNPKPDKIYQSNPQYTWGYVLYFADYYSNVGIENNVVSLSLFTENMKVENGSLSGMGQYLYLEEICLTPTDTILPTGLYTLNDTREPMTALPGQVPEEYPYTIIGANITYVDDDGVEYMLIKEGSFTVHSASDDGEGYYDYHITFDFVTTRNMALKGEFNGKLFWQDYQRQNTEPEEQGVRFLESRAKNHESRRF